MEKQFFLKKIQLSMSTKLNGSKYCYVSLTIQLNISHLFTQLNDEIVLFQKLQFSISILFISIGPKDRTLSSATTAGQSRSGSNGNEGVFHIPQSSSITEASL